MKRVLLFLLVGFSSFVFAADHTNFASVRQMNYDGNADYTYFLADNGWEVKNADGSILCSPTYVQVKNNVPGRDKILSMGLAAYMANKQVQFHGTCTEGASYFHAHYIIIGNN